MTRTSYSYDVFERFTERLPKADDRLFSPGHDSFFADATAERNYRMLQGYKRAGDVLIQNALADPYDRHSLIFPALFNYRHYIELALKAIVEEHGAFAGISLGSKNHKLSELWGLFVKIATAFGHDGSNELVVAVGACIGEFADVDTNSTVFRYPSNLDGSTTPLPRHGIGLMRVHDVMNGIENFLEGADLDFTHKAESAAEAMRG